MFSNVAKIEAILSGLERIPQKQLDDTHLEQLVQLRELAVSNWDHARPEDPETPDLCHLRDRIVDIEQRILALAARMPADSLESLRRKLLLWMLDNHISLEPGEQETTADRLIASVYQDTERLAEINDTPNAPRQKPILKSVK